MPPSEAALGFGAKHRDRIIEEFTAFCAIPGVSALSQHKSDLVASAQWVAGQLTEVGIEQVELLPTAGAPVVTGEWCGAQGRPTVLIYGHYDVQPADPLDEWDSPPFEPVVRGEDLYARGASDNKGQIFAALKALEAIGGSFPVNLVFLIEGEEEIGSPSLEAFIEAHKERFACDAILNCDGGIHAVEVPSITYGLRGLAYFELEVRGPAQDLHSGVFGGAVHNPAQVLCELIAGMHDAKGRVTLPDFYESVRPLEKEEREALAGLAPSDEEWGGLTGAPAPWGEAGFSALECIGARPTLEVNGLISGFVGEGAKTVLPARALAKLSARLVPDQDSHEVARQLRAYLEESAPLTVTWELRELAHAAPALVDRGSPAVRAAARALEETYGRAPAFKRDGGTIPVVSLLQQHIGVDSVLLGFELPDAGFHGPNEHMHLPTLFRGIATYIRFFHLL